MKDIFDAKIICEKCNREMKQTSVIKRGFRLRAVECNKCNEKIIHPTDLNKLSQYNDMKRKTYNVKLRVVGNSHTVSIPKEIVDFINDSNQRMKRHVNDMVKLCFEDFGKLSLNFFGDENRRKKTWREMMERD
jgi:hypothetical protein